MLQQGHEDDMAGLYVYADLLNTLGHRVKIIFVTGIEMKVIRLKA